MRRSGRGRCDRAGRFIEVEDGKSLVVGWTIHTSRGKVLEQRIT